MLRSGVVAFLDALGVKGIWARPDADQITADWREVIGKFSAIEAGINNDPRCASNACRVRAFSDTVIVTIEEESYPLVLFVIAEYLTDPFLFALTRGFFFRGVITVGEFDGRSESLLFGPAVDDAASWYEHADWVGISTTPVASFVLERELLATQSTSPYFRKYPIPTGANTSESWSWALDWPVFALQEAATQGRARDAVEAWLYDVFSSRPIPSSVVSKYSNTLAFFKETPELAPLAAPEGAPDEAPQSAEPGQ